MENILDIIYYYSSHYKIIDDIIIKKIIDLIKEKDNLSNLQFNIDNNKLFMKSDLHGSFINNTINIYLYRILKYINKYCYQSDFLLEYKLSNTEIYLRKNLLILKIIYHEIEHYYHSQICKNNLNNSLQNELIILEEKTIDDVYFNYINGIKISKYYDISFIERLADSNAYKKLLELINPIKDEILNLYTLEEYLLLDRHFDTYYDNDSPTLRYFKFVNKEQESLNILNKYNINNLCFDDRLFLGLKLEDYEYNTVKEYLKSKKR